MVDNHYAVVQKQHAQDLRNERVSHTRSLCETNHSQSHLICVLENNQGVTPSEMLTIISNLKDGQVNFLFAGTVLIFLITSLLTGLCIIPINEISKNRVFKLAPSAP